MASDRPSRKSSLSRSSWAEKWEDFKQEYPPQSTWVSSIVTLYVTQTANIPIFIGLFFLMRYMILESERPTDPDWGWYMLGNNSLLSPHVMARTDENPDSQTYGLWTPPPEWEETCIRGYGSPMTACSYFAGKEYPGFMKFFYTVYFLCGFISIINLVITMCQMFKYLVGCYKKHNKNMFLPSKVEAIPECTQAHFFRGFFCLCMLLFYCQRLGHYFYLAMPGLGITESIGAGFPYLGAKWNQSPIPMPDELYELWQPWIISMPLQCLLMPRILFYAFTPNGHFNLALHHAFGAVMPWDDEAMAFSPLLLCYAFRFVGVVQVNNPRIFVGPVPASGTGSLKAWWKFFCNPKKQYEGDFGREGITNWFRLFIIPTGYYVWTDFPNRALWSLTMYKKGTWNDDSVKKEWLFTMNGFNRATFCVAWMIYFGVFAPILISAIFLPFWRAGRGMTGGLSAAVQARYKNLLKVVLQYYSYFLVFWTLNLFICPNKMMLQSWGYDNTFGDSAWLFGGNSNTERSHLLFAPIQRMLCALASLVVEMNFLCIFSPNRMINFS